MKLPYTIPASLAPLTLTLTFAALALAGCTGVLKKGPVSQGYEFAAVSRGSLEKTVSASGTLQPVATVKVLSRMNGKVDRLHVDYNDRIQKGDILAELNTDTLRLQREQQMAQVIKARANYELQAVNYANLERLAAKNLIADYELKTGKTTLAIQRADLAAAEASLKVIETEINQYAFITSPINGIVLERNISVGDTVVEGSSSNSSSLFTLAENLEEMRIEASVGELDVTSIYKGQAVRFTLESLPGRTFTGEVETLRLVPAVQNNVVSYTVIITVENREGTLLPGMTCAVEFIVERRENILMVPNAALRYQPTGLSAEEIADMVFNAGLKDMTEEQRAAAIEARAQRVKAQNASGQGVSTGTGLAGLVMPAAGGPGARGPMMGGPGTGQPRQSGGGSGTNRAAGSAPGGMPAIRSLWHLNSEEKPELIRVRIGITNGAYTELRSGEDLEGTWIIVREKL